MYFRISRTLYQAALNGSLFEKVQRDIPDRKSSIAVYDSNLTDVTPMHHTKSANSIERHTLSGHFIACTLSPHSSIQLDEPQQEERIVAHSAGGNSHISCTVAMGPAVDQPKEQDEQHTCLATHVMADNGSATRL